MADFFLPTEGGPHIRSGHVVALRVVRGGDETFRVQAVTDWGEIFTVETGLPSLVDAEGQLEELAAQLTAPDPNPGTDDEQQEE